MTHLRKWIYPVALLSAVAVVYGQFLWNPIVFDDAYFFLAGSDVLDNFTHSFSLLDIRWLPYATIAWTKRVLGTDLIWFRLEGLILHALVGVTLFYFLRHLYQIIFSDNKGKNDKQPWLAGAFIAALLFVLHPVAVYGAAYLVERTIVMATLFSLLALLSTLKGLEKDSLPWLWGSVVCYFLAVLSKESAIMLPGAMFALTILAAGTNKTLFKRLWPLYLACFLGALFVLSQKLGLIGTAYEPDAPQMLEHALRKAGSGGAETHQVAAEEHIHLLSVFTQCALFFKYLGLWLLPNPDWMSVDMREPFAGSLKSPHLIAVFCFITYGGVATWLLFKRGKYGLIGLAMLFPWMLFFTEFSVIRIQESFVLYRSYLWMSGIFIALPLLLMHLKPRVAIVSGGLLALLLAVVTAERLTTFSHPLLLWDDAEKLVHDKRDLLGVDRIYGNRALSFDSVKRYPDAIADYQTALKLRPDSVSYMQGMAITYLHMGDYPKAIEAFDKTIELDPRDAKSYFGRGSANENLGNKLSALADFGKSCELGRQSGCVKVEQLKGASNSYLPIQP